MSEQAENISSSASVSESHDSTKLVERPSKRMRFISVRPQDHEKQPERSAGQGEREPVSRSGSPRPPDCEHGKEKPKRGRKPSSCAECRRCVNVVPLWLFSEAAALMILEYSCTLVQNEAQVQSCKRPARESSFIKS